MLFLTIWRRRLMRLVCRMLGHSFSHIDATGRGCGKCARCDMLRRAKKAKVRT